MILQLNPSIPVMTPKGEGLAQLVIDYGPEHDLIWVVFLNENRECWSYKNSQIRAVKNVTFERC